MKKHVSLMLVAKAIIVALSVSIVDLFAQGNLDKEYKEAFDAAKKILKEKISDGELATTKTSCLGCLADDISWEIYYLMKEKEEEA